MPVTISYDFKNAKPNDRTYIRSMRERFGWQRLGGSVFRYPHSAASDTAVGEDWLNAVVPALMFFRSFVLHRRLRLTKFTVDASSVSFVDLSDPKSLSHNVCNAGSFLGFVVRAPHAPQKAERWRGGDGSVRGAAAATDDLGDPGRPVVDRAACPAARGVAALARTALDSAAPHPRRRALRAPDRLPVESGPADVCVGLDGPSPLPAVGRTRHLGSDVAPAPAVL